MLCILDFKTVFPYGFNDHIGEKAKQKEIVLVDEKFLSLAKKLFTCNKRKSSSKPQ